MLKLYHYLKEDGYDGTDKRLDSGSARNDNEKNASERGRDIRTEREQEESGASEM